MYIITFTYLNPLEMGDGYVSFHIAFVYDTLSTTSIEEEVLQDL